MLKHAGWFVPDWPPLPVALPPARDFTSDDSNMKTNMKTKNTIATGLLELARVPVVALLLAVVACGCRIAMPQQKMESRIHEQNDIGVTQDQVRLRVRSLVGPMCGGIEQAADQIIAGTTNPVVQRGALVWKIEAVPSMRAALFQPNPFTAVFDAWVLCDQMADYFEAGPGSAALGDASPIAVAACGRLEEEISRVAASVSISGDVSKARTFAKNWAREHPIRHSISDRETTLSRVLEQDAAGSLSTGEAVAGITTTLDDLNRRLEVYSDQMVRQARWEAELFRSDLLTDLPLGQAMPLAGRAVTSAEQVAATVDRLGPMVERAVLAAENAPKCIASEREATILALHAERVASLMELHEAMAVERKALTQDIELISLKVVDHAFWRAAQLLAAVLAVLAIGLAGIVILLKRS